MPSKTYNKAVINGVTYIDLSSDTVTADKLLLGYTAHDKNGEAITGTATSSSVVVSDTIDAAGGTIRTITAQEAIYLQEKTITPTSSQQVVEPDTGYDGFSQVTVEAGGGSTTIESLSVTPSESQQTFNSSSVDGYKPVTVGAISSTYVGSGIARKSSTDLMASGDTVTAPAGYYASNATKTISSGSATPAASISGTSASVSTGTNTLTLTKTVSNTPQVSAGYISSGTAGNTSVSLTANVTTKAAATITPGTSNQTIASGTYLTGTQTISGDSNLVSGNIISGKSIFGVSGSVVLQTVYTGSSAPSSSTGSNGDIYIQS